MGGNLIGTNVFHEKNISYDQEETSRTMGFCLGHDFFIVDVEDWNKIQQDEQTLIN